MLLRILARDNTDLAAYRAVKQENKEAFSNMAGAQYTMTAADIHALKERFEEIIPAGAEKSKGNASEQKEKNTAAEGRKRSPGIVKKYTTAKWNTLDAQQKQTATANMAVVEALAKRTGRTIEIVDELRDKKGRKVNATYDPRSGQIRVAMDADGMAYAYAAAHELTHAMKNEHSGEWKAFSEYVLDTLRKSGEDVDALIDRQMEQFGYSREDALEEVVCNTAPAMLQDESNLFDLYKGNRTLFERVVEWVKGMLTDVKAAGEQLAKRSKSWAQMDALKDQRAELQTMYDRMMDVMSRPVEKSQSGSQKNSVKEQEHYDYSKPFVEQVEDLREGRIPTKDALLISGTPDVLKKIGFSDLPLTINQEHLLSMERDTEHVLSNELLKQLPELVKDPVAVITSGSNSDASTVMILKAMVNGKPYVAPVYISSQGRANNAVIDSNNIATVFRKGNTVSKLLTDAIQKENADQVGVYYWKKSEARDLYSVAGVQFPRDSVQDGLNHSIFDAGSPVNRKFIEQTETRQFQRWFGDSKVVNEDGTAKVMYRGGGEDIAIFDRKKSKSSNLYGRGFYFTEDEAHAKQYGDVREYYLRIENPLDASSGERSITTEQMRAFLQEVEEGARPQRRRMTYAIYKTPKVPGPQWLEMTPPALVTRISSK